MQPAHQRLSRVQTAGRQTQLGLVEHLQLILVERLAQLIFQLQTLQRAGLQVLGIELKIIAAQMFGMLHGHVRLTDQRRDLSGRVWQQADAH